MPIIHTVCSHSKFLGKLFVARDCPYTNPIPDWVPQPPFCQSSGTKRRARGFLFVFAEGQLQRLPLPDLPPDSVRLACMVTGARHALMSTCNEFDAIHAYL